MSNNDYPSAGDDAPPEIKSKIDEMLEKGLPDDLPLLYAILGSGTPPYKMSKDDSEYQDEPSGEQQCSNCEFAYKKVVRDRYICSQIRGPIKSEGWCRLWVPPRE